MRRTFAVFLGVLAFYLLLLVAGLVLLALAVRAGEWLLAL